MVKPAASKALQNKTTTLTFLNKEIATCTPSSSSSSSSSTETPVATLAEIPIETPSTKRKSRTTNKSNPIEVEELESPSSKTPKKPRTTTQALSTQKTVASSKKSECVYRGYRVKKGEEKGTLGGKIYVESVCLVDEEKEGDKVKENDSVIIKQGKKVRVFGVEKEVVVIGLSVPVSGHKYTVYTYEKESSKIESYPLDDLVEIVMCTTTDEEEKECTRITELWWGGIKKPVEVKKEKTAKSTPQRRSLSSESGESTTSVVITLNKLIEKIGGLTHRVAQLEQQMTTQGQRFEEATRDNFKLMMTNSIEMIKAVNRNL